MYATQAVDQSILIGEVGGAPSKQFRNERRLACVTCSGDDEGLVPKHNRACMYGTKAFESFDQSIVNRFYYLQDSVINGDCRCDPLSIYKDLK